MNRTEFVMCASQRFCEQYYTKIQTSMESVCLSMGIKIKPLSLFLKNGFTEQEFFDSIGNKDGAAARCKDTYYIFYNDRQPHHRIRFTLAEELMHIVLGHTDDTRFRFGTPYLDEVYNQYEYEAKLG